MLRGTMAPDDVAVVVDDTDDTYPEWGGPDVEDDFDDVLVISNLENALKYRWSCLGRVFAEGYAASLAQTLHAHEVFVINDIDYIDWGNVPYDDFGLEPIDVRTLDMIKSCDDNVAIDLMAKAQVMQNLPTPEFVKKSGQWSYSV